MDFLDTMAEEEKLRASGGGRKLSRTSDGLLLRRPNHFGSCNGGSEKVRDKRCGRKKLNRGSEYFDIEREKASPATTAEENNFGSEAKKANVRRQADRFMLRMAKRFGIRNGRRETSYQPPI